MKFFIEEPKNEEPKFGELTNGSFFTGIKSGDLYLKVDNDTVFNCSRNALSHWADKNFPVNAPPANSRIIFSVQE